jgi:hypothetical protein
MRIVFDLYDVGLGNNGGSRTVVKSAEAMASLGVDVIIYSNHKSYYTWHEPQGVKFIHGGICPSCDVILATGYRSFIHAANSKANKKYGYIRGHEIWNISESKLFEAYKLVNCIVNSEWLQKHLSKHGIHSDLVYPGLDFDKFQILQQDRPKIIGALYSSKHKTKRHKDAQEVANKLGVKLVMLNKHIQNPSEEKLNEWYNNIAVWFAPTELEGLHNPPMEASLAGCGLVCTSHIRNGMTDYAKHKETALVYQKQNIADAAKCTSELLNDEALRNGLNGKMIELLKNKIGNREQNMKKMLDIFNGG